MEGVAVADETCAVFGGLSDLEPSAIHRFVVGEDQAPRTLSPEEAAAEPGDLPFLQRLFVARHGAVDGRNLVPGGAACRGRSRCGPGRQAPASKSRAGISQPRAEKVAGLVLT